MEINVTAVVVGMRDRLRFFSCSQAEMGEHATKASWAWANVAARELLIAGKNLLQDEHLPEFRNYVRGFGAWEREEIDSWSRLECEAILIQFVAGDARAYLEAEENDELDEYLEREGGRLYETIDSDGARSWYYYVGI